MNEATPTRKSGDAAGELQKLRATRQRQASASKQRRFVAGLGLDLEFSSKHSGHSTVSPTTLTEGSLHPIHKLKEPGDQVCLQPSRSRQ